MVPEFNSESEFADALCKRLDRDLRGVNVQVGKSLLYKIIVDEAGQQSPSSVNDPKRGQYAFQTDLLVSKRKPPIPLVAVELKYGGFSTHDVLTYSSKAIKHKEIYPYLRYGFVAGGQSSINRKFFVHNVGFDFAVAILTLDRGYSDLLKVVRGQVKAAKRLITVLKKDQKLSRYETHIRIH